MAEDFEDFYAILEIAPNASRAEIKKAWRARVKKCHPDCNLENRDYWEELCRKINGAYDVLSDADSRAHFDKTRAEYFENLARAKKRQAKREEEKKELAAAAAAFAEEQRREALRRHAKEERKVKRHNARSPARRRLLHYMIFAGSVGVLFFGVAMVFLLSQEPDSEKKNAAGNQRTASNLPLPNSDEISQNRAGENQAPPEIVAKEIKTREVASVPEKTMPEKVIDEIKNLDNFFDEFETAKIDTADKADKIDKAEKTDKIASSETGTQSKTVPEKILEEINDLNAFFDEFETEKGKSGTQNRHATGKVVEKVEDLEGLVKKRFSDGSTPLLRECLEGDFEKVKALIGAGADVNALDENRQNALHYACRSPKVSPSLLEILVKNGVRVAAKDRAGKMPIHYLAGTASKEIFEFWLKKFPNQKDAQDSKSLTALCWAFDKRNLEVFEYLLENGARPNAVPLNKSTLLHEAVDAGEVKFVAALVKARVRANVRNHAGDTPLILLCSTVKTKPEIEVEIAKLLVEGKARLDIKNRKDGNTPLHLVAAGHNTKLAEYLISAGAALSEKNRAGETPAMYALHRGNATMYYLLQRAAQEKLNRN